MKMYLILNYIGNIEKNSWHMYKSGIFFLKILHHGELNPQLKNIMMKNELYVF